MGVVGGIFYFLVISLFNCNYFGSSIFTCNHFGRSIFCGKYGGRNIFWRRYFSPGSFWCFFVKIVEDIVEKKIIAVLVLCQVLY